MESVPEFVKWGVTLAGKRTGIMMTRMHAFAQEPLSLEECELLIGLRRRRWLPCCTKDPVPEGAKEKGKLLGSQTVLLPRRGS